MSSVKNNKSSILFTPVIKNLGSNFNTCLLITWYVRDWDCTLKETIKSNFPPALKLLASWINQYMVSLAPSSYAPIQTAKLDKGAPRYIKVVSWVFPLEFSTAPISVVSVDPNLTLIAFIYWPGGTKRSSTLLFIFPAIKFVFTIGILL